jgi:G patch domain-containing protein 1
MGVDSDSDDYVLVGTPIEMAETRSKTTAGAVARAPPVWQQTPTDEQGRRRFHGAFTGGFSAGYYNTVGSKEGWTPSSFVSSRSARRARAEDTQREARDFMDEDERMELDAQRTAVTTRVEFDSAKARAEAHGAAELHRAELDGSRPQALPGPVPSELIVVPASEAIGMRLLRKMGWRPGAGQGGEQHKKLAVKVRARTVNAALSTLLAGEEAVLAGDDAEAHDATMFGVPAAADDAEEEAVEEGEKDDSNACLVDRMRRRRRRWGLLAGALAEDDDVVFPAQKLDTHGLGYDPFSGAEEFRAIKRRREEFSRPTTVSAMHGSGARSAMQRHDRGTAFGVGIFEDGEDEDVYGDTDPRRRALLSLPTVADDDEASDDDQLPQMRRPALAAHPERLAIAAPPSRHPGAFGLDGFVRATETEAPPKYYPPPVVPRDFKPVHTFSQPLLRNDGSRAQPVEKPPTPTDAELVRRCDTLAAFVARNGLEFEALARQRQASDPRFTFLFGGPGADYYLWRRATLGAAAPPAPPPERRSRPLTASERGVLLGETPAAVAAATAPIDTVAMQAKMRGIADSDRAALVASLGRTFTKETGAVQPPPTRYGLQTAASRFASGGVEVGGHAVASDRAPSPDALPAGSSGMTVAMLPPVQRTVDDWGPEPLLCKRFGVPDPYKGRHRPAERRTFRSEMLALPATAAEAAEAAPKFLDAVPSQATTSTHHEANPLPPVPPAAERIEPGAAPGAASDEVDDFFASLATAPVPSDVASSGGTAVLAPGVPERRPLDLFKAIFEPSDDEGEDDEEDGGAPAAEQVPAVAPPAAAAAAEQPAVAPRPPAPLSALEALAKELRKEKKRHKGEHKHKHKSKHKHHKKKTHRKRSRSRSASGSEDTSSSKS